MALVGVCQHAVRPTASYRTLELGGTASTIGVIASSYAVLAVLTAIPLGRALDRADPKRYFVWGVGILLVGTMVSALAPTVVALGVGQAFAGLGRMTSAVSIQTLVANRRHSNRDQGFARLAVANSIGQLLGPSIAGGALDLAPDVVPEFSPSSLSFIVAAAFGLAGTLVAVRAIDSEPSRRTGPSSTDESRAPVTTILRRKGVPQSLLVGLAVMTAIDLTTVYLPLLGESRGIAASTIGLLLSIRAVAGLLSRLALTYTLQRFGRRRLLLVSLLAAGGAVLGIATFETFLLLAPMLFVMGYGLGIGTPLTMSWLAVQAPREERGTALAIRMTGSRLAQIVLPVTFGGLASLLGPGAVFVGMAVTLLAGASVLRASPVEPPAGRGT
ncbi:MFS transporter [Egicoccus halophilus]|uniref:Major facilitator superfamily (MFS) profile domain-containing protein n=1 Tax=Egicoccus halophilus TaxID=1670830 RepID=A0A8J3EYC0_9ACTN|nr:MFS transporter [Egicoccus halophilus]GGI07574.1 hypothetical protein GCM10011354_24770 [Egicoccus halophilus]